MLTFLDAITSVIASLQVWDIGHTVQIMSHKLKHPIRIKHFEQPIAAQHCLAHKAIRPFHNTFS